MSRERMVLVILGLVLLGLVLRVVLGDDPWTGGVARRLSRDLNVRPIDYARTYRWWISGANALVVLALLLTRRRWLGRDRVEESGALPPPMRRAGAWFCLLVAGAMAVGGFLAWPRMDHSLWDDEEYTVRRSLDGVHRPNEAGELVFDEVPWRDSFLYTLRFPNNHVPFTLVARLCLSAWRAVAQPPWRMVHEPAVRVPAFVAGLGSMLAMAFFLRRIGYPGAGLLAAWVLALHPWHLRYTSEARGYSLLMMLVPLLLWALVNALHRGTWRRWMLFGAAQLLLLWVYPGGLAILAVVNAVAAWEILRLHGRRPMLGEQARRWLVTSLLSAALWAQLMLPNMLIFALHADWPTKPVDGAFVLETVSHLFAGVAWTHGRWDDHYVVLAKLASASPLLFYGLLGTSLAAMALGILRLLAAGGVRSRLLWPLLLPAPITLLGAWLQESLVHPWYFIFALPSAVLLLAVGLEAAFAWRSSAGRAAALAMGLYLVAFAWLTHPPREALRAGSLQPAREAVLLTRPTLDPFDPRQREILTVSWHGAPAFYDPWIRVVSGVDELEDLLEEADASGRALYLNYGRPELARVRAPELMEMAGREHLFELVGSLFGFEPRGLMRIYRYRGSEAAPGDAVAP